MGPAPAPVVHDGRERLAPGLRGSTLLLGSFDGMHRGHLALLRRAAAGGGLISALQCDPHPRVFLAGARNFRLASAGVQRHLLERAGVGLVYAPRFDAAFAATRAEDFVADHLVGRLGVSAVVLGRDFRFGAGREGDAALLRLMGRAMGFDTLVVPDECEEGERISSSLIRAEIAAGRIARAVRLIGHPWLLGLSRAGGPDGGASGGEGSWWVFAPEQILPPDGRYAVETRDAAGRRLGPAVLTIEGRCGRMAADGRVAMAAFGPLRGRGRT